MPRKYNHRLASRQAVIWRTEHMRDRIQDARAARRSARQVQSGLESVARYGVLKKAAIKLDVQAAIDAIELRHINAERIELGLAPFETMEAALAGPAPPPEPQRPPPYNSSDYA